MRTADGDKDVDCARKTDIIKDVWLCARACTVIRDGECVGDVKAVHTWPCDVFHGSTLFEITSGRKELWIDVRCADGAAADVVVPEPIVRDIADGEVSELNAVLISVPVDPVPACPGGATVTDVCQNVR